MVLTIPKMTEEQRVQAKDKRVKELDNIIIPEFLKILARMIYSDNWHLKDFFTPVEACQLAFGLDPKHLRYDAEKKKMSFTKVIPNLTKVIDRYNCHTNSYLTDAEREDKLKPLKYHSHNMEKLSYLLDAFIDAVRFNQIETMYQSRYGYEYCTQISREEIQKFLIKKSIESDFFDTSKKTIKKDFPKYMNKDDTNLYCPKLCLAIEAYNHLITLYPHNMPKGKSTKDIIREYVRDNAARFGLDGSKKNGVQKEIISIVNYPDQKIRK